MVGLVASTAAKPVGQDTVPALAVQPGLGSEVQTQAVDTNYPEATLMP